MYGYLRTITKGTPCSNDGEVSFYVFRCVDNWEKENRDTYMNVPKYTILIPLQQNAKKVTTFLCAV
jgi:hypothetical protein